MASLLASDIFKRRRIVVHHTHLLQEKILEGLHQNDIVFFDDCLFSQYVFLKQHIQFFIQNSIDCVLSFSSALYAPEDAQACQICEVESKVLHDACNKTIQSIVDADRLRFQLQELNGFMKISQLKELLELPHVHLAMHGCCHLDLSKIKCNVIDQIKIFERDLDDGLARLVELDLQTKMYVYPYVFSFPLSDRVLQSRGFTQIVGSKLFRLPIEDPNEGCFS